VRLRQGNVDADLGGPYMYAVDGDREAQSRAIPPILAGLIVEERSREFSEMEIVDQQAEFSEVRRLDHQNTRA
jgi:hypothetical protein